jgi:calcineurin-like phosphoesterase family protein
VAIFFTADTHFGHAGALALYRRPFTSVEDMNAAMIARWNETIGPDDEVWHLGDFAINMKAKRAAELLQSLNGRKHLIIGNNDPPDVAGLPGWSTARHYAEVEADGHRLVLCHFAFRTWNGMKKGALNLHGHSHGRLKPLPRQADVGVDVRDLRPVRVAEL